MHAQQQNNSTVSHSFLGVRTQELQAYGTLVSLDVRTEIAS